MHPLLTHHSSLCLSLLLTLTSLTPTRANTQMPKVFVDVPAIKLIDPLRSGFQIVLEEHFVHHYLNPTKLPTIFLSVLPLNRNQPQVHDVQPGSGPGPGLRRMMYREDIEQDSILVDGLTERSWYYICVEFENVVRRANRGNTSTSCRLARTLDEFGKRADGTVRDIHISEIRDRSMDFQIAVDANFPIRLMAYLDGEGSAPMQTYIVTQPKSLRVRFSGLVPGEVYGRFCILEQPLVPTYSMMGREIHASAEACHFNDLRTKLPTGTSGTLDGEDGVLKPLASTLRLQRSSNSGPSMMKTSDTGGWHVSSHVIIVALLVCVLTNIAIPCVPLAYLITCGSSKPDTSSASKSRTPSMKFSRDLNSNERTASRLGDCGCAIADCKHCGDARFAQVHGERVRLLVNGDMVHRS